MFKAVRDGHAQGVINQVTTWSTICIYDPVSITTVGSFLKFNFYCNVALFPNFRKLKKYKRATNKFCIQDQK